jgi:hypothetical protein
MALRGDPQLLSYFPAETSIIADRPLSIWYTLIWDLYPLPNGNMNPGRTGSSHTPKLLMSPSYDMINQALNELIQPSLLLDEEWLLSIPREIADLGVLEAEALLTGEGSAAIRYPEAAIPNLFFINELFLELRLQEHSHLQSDLRASAERSISTLLAVWLTTINVTEVELYDKIADNLSNIRYARRSAGDYGQYQIWSTTIVQQAFLLLHELGHLVEHDKKQLVPKGSSLYRFTSPTLEQELSADIWAAIHLRRLATYWFEGETRWMSQPLLDLFGSLEILRQDGFIPGHKDIFLERWTAVSKTLFDRDQSTPMTGLAYLENIGDLAIKQIKPYRRLVPFKRPRSFNMGPVIQFDQVKTYEGATEFSNTSFNFEERVSILLDDAHTVLLQIGKEYRRLYYDSKAKHEKRVGFDENLMISIVMFEAALRRNSFDTQSAAAVSYVLSHDFQEMFYLTRDRFYLEMGIARSKRAVCLAKDNDRKLAAYLHALGVGLWCRYDECTGTREDIIAAMEAIEQAIIRIADDEQIVEKYLKSFQGLAKSERAEGFLHLYNLSCNRPEITLKVKQFLSHCLS